MQRIQRPAKLVSWALVALALGLLAAVPAGDALAKGPTKKGASAKRKGAKKGAAGSPTKRKGKRRRRRGCPTNMVKVGGAYCVDRYEAYINIILPGGRLKRHSPFKAIDKKVKNIKALNRRGRMPQAYISQRQAEIACNNAGKRLCSDSEWVKACKGKKPTAWPYGADWQPGRCNDSGISSFNLYFGKDGREALQSAYTWENLNDPRLNKPKGTCAPAGRFKRCKNSYKVYDMAGNLHEWTAASGGTFRGGYYLDARKHGDGCDYKTTAHDRRYHDYSTGFRCCKDQ